MALGIVNGSTSNTVTDINTAVIVNRDVTIDKMVRYVDGSDWTVNFYNPIRHTDDGVNNPDPDENGIEHQYVSIKNLTIKVTAPLEPGSLETLGGSGTIPVNIVPQIGAVFTARIFSGELGLFTVTEVVEKSYALERIFDVTYVLDTTDTINPNKITTIIGRVVKEYVYDDELFIDGHNPIIKEAVYDTLEKLRKGYINLTRKYYNKFIHNSGYLVLIKNGDTIIDPYMNCLFDYVKSNDVTMQYSITTPSDINKTFIGMLINGEGIGKDVPCRLQSNIPSKKYQHYRLREHFPFSINYIIYIDSEPDEDTRLIIDGDNTNLPIGNDTHYIFKSVCPLTTLYKQAINNEKLNMDVVLSLIANTDTWSDDELYFYLPLLLFIVKYVITENQTI